MAKYTFSAFIIINLISVFMAQDFEPLPLEDAVIQVTSTTTDSTTAATKISGITDAPDKLAHKPTKRVETTTNEQPITDSPFHKLTTTTTAKTTTATSSTTTTAEARTTKKSTTTYTESTNSATTTDMPPVTVLPIPKEPPAHVPHPTLPRPTLWQPAYPSVPNYGSNQCYYKSQQGFPQLNWICGRLQYTSPIECYHCCRYTNSFFAGCYKVHNNFCESNTDWYDFSYRK